jgi:hypothetical protein
MSNELIAPASPGLTIDANVISSTAQRWNGTAFETYSSANYANYAITMTENGSSGIYIGSFPTTITTGGTYQIIFYRRSGASPAEGDAIVSTQDLVWNGSAVVSGTVTASGSQMNFITMQQELSDRVPVYDETISTDATKLKRWLNMGQRYILSKNNWDFMVAYETVQTVTDITTGTASVSAGGTAVTLSSGPSVSVQNRYIKFSSADDWYEITSHSAGSTSLTIGTAYGQSSSLSAGTFQIRKLLYTTTTPMESILDIKKTVNPGRLESVNRREGDFFLPLYFDPGDVWEYIIAPLNSSGYPQFSLVNPPDTVFNLMVRGQKTFADMSADTDTSAIPWRWHTAIIHMAAFYAFQSVADPRATDEFQMAENQISDMARVYNMDKGRHRVMSSVDSNYGFGPVYTLPSNYGRMY